MFDHPNRSVLYALRRAHTHLCIRALMCLSILSMFGACSSRYTYEDVEDELAPVSQELEPADVRALFKQASDSLTTSGFMRLLKAYHARGETITLATLPLTHAGPAPLTAELQQLMRDLTTRLRGAGELKVIDRSADITLNARIQGATPRRFDKANVAALGLELKARYLLTGALYAVPDASGETRRIQHFLFMQVIEAQRGATPWQVEVEVMKGLDAGELESGSFEEEEEEEEE